VDENERKVSETLDKLYKEINRSAADSLPSSVIKSLPSVTTGSSAEIDQLEKIMSTINTSGEDDREMKRLDGMLDKILLIQNPAAFRASAAPSIADKSLPVSARSQSVTQPASPVEQQGFYGLNSSTIDTGASLPHGFLAVIHDDRTVQDGATVKLRLLQDIYVGNIVIPENSFLYGQSSLGNQRLNIEIKNAVINNRIVPVRLSVYDIDGITGIYCPGAVSQEVARNGLNQAIQNLELYSVDPSIGAQAATAGIQAAKSLVGKKAKAVNVSLKTGHTVLLYNSQN
jgi:conjugative transposon TraM protein